MLDDNNSYYADAKIWINNSIRFRWWRYTRTHGSAGALRKWMTWLDGGGWIKVPGALEQAWWWWCVEWLGWDSTVGILRRLGGGAVWWSGSGTWHVQEGSFGGKLPSRQNDRDTWQLLFGVRCWCWCSSEARALELRAMQLEVGGYGSSMFSLLATIATA